MKPFFSIRIDWNPADSEDESHRDGFSVRRSVARQTKPCPKWVNDDKKRSAPLRDDVGNVVQAITSSIEDLARDSRWTLPDLIADVVFDLAIRLSLQEQVLRLAEIAVEGCEDAFLDGLQTIIDDERKKHKEEPQA